MATEAYAATPFCKKTPYVVDRTALAAFYREAKSETRVLVMTKKIKAIQLPMSPRARTSSSNSIEKEGVLLAISAIRNRDELYS